MRVGSVTNIPVCSTSMPRLGRSEQRIISATSRVQHALRAVNSAIALALYATARCSPTQFWG
nr:hypothetical protein [Deltaproteobacteria bacterium]